ncbi:hypothetical protein [Actinomycetospora sp. CA-084318]|uniref:hypothetical protein n=1 Tax=Actinomycetospora sp. CA-084318 TaxID=3239892 RepID=UPI003D96232F
MSAATGEDLLCAAARAVLRDVDGPIFEGLCRAAADQVTTHALALTARAAHLAAFPERRRVHGLGLWDLIAVLSGPMAIALLRQLDEALGSAP